MVLTMGEVIYFNSNFMIYSAVLPLALSFGSNDIVNLPRRILKQNYL